MPLDTERMAEDVRKLRKTLKKMDRESSPAEVHKLRRRARRIEAALGALPAVAKGSARHLARDCRRLRRRAGRVRDMDVLTSHLAAAHVDDDPDCLVRLFEYLGAERYRQARRLHAMVDKKGRTVRKGLKRTASRIQGLAKEGRDDQRRTAAEAAGSAMTLSKQLANPAVLTRRNLHAYRLKLKELRDVLQLGGNAGHKKFVSLLGSAKDTIGEWHDWEELIAIAGEVLDDGPHCRLQRRLKARSDRAYRRALAAANRLRKEYLQSSPKAARSQRGQKALKAIATMAA